MKIKKIVLIMLVIIIVIGIVALLLKGGTKKSNNAKLHIVSSNFASYDFLRAIIGDNKEIDLIFLVGPGKDAHSYDPTASDLIKIQDSDLFIYVGGEMEKWAEKVIGAISTQNTKIVCIADYIDKIEEKEVDGAEEENDNEDDNHVEGAFDEHIWTSPANAIKMIDKLEETMEEIDSENDLIYRENADKYIDEIKKVDDSIQEIVNNKVRNRLIFADKMPMQYFIDYYNLEVSAAFNGCSTETDPSASTIAYLISKAKEEKVPVILYIELNPGTVAKTIADEIGNGCETMQIQTLHNVSLDDFKNGETWVSLMNRNLDVLKKALQ